MDDASLDIVFEALDEASLDEETESLVLAVCQGEEQLEAALGDTPVEEPARPPPREDVEPPAVYLTGVDVAGFRGIGPVSSLELQPGPGLTLIIGRNGSGKSSFAEAIEYSLTGRNARWEDRLKAWSKGWRNLHAEGPTEITTRVAVDGSGGETRIERRWEPGDDLDEVETAVQPPGKPATDLASFGWEEPLALYRPFLPYSELGSMLEEGRAALYDALSGVLGLEPFEDVREMLRQARLEHERALKELRSDAEELIADLEELDDERAATVAQAIRPGQEDLSSVEEVLSSEGEAGRADLLRRLRDLPEIDDELVESVAGDLDEANANLEELSGSDAARDREVAQLLEQALNFHADHGDVDCPVCGQGRLDDQWEESTREHIADLREQAKVVEDAHELRKQALREAASIAASVPDALDHAEDEVEVDVAPALAAQEELAGLVKNAEELSGEELLEAVERMTAARQRIREAADRRFTEMEAAWRPFVNEIAAWVRDARPALAGEEPLTVLRTAEGFTKNLIGTVRSRRWEPIADQARQVWSKLRQRSHVALEDIELAGTGRARRVDVDVTVDDVPGVALGVMSQGELHSLALSLFLPRATSSASPFRFLVIDDPVQSMDPAKVDGLARVLAEAAETYQVVVFTHDDRLPESIRRLQLPARVLEVTRDRASRVEVRPVDTPTGRYLDDARSLTFSDAMPAEVRQRVVPGFCRLALESTCHDVVRQRRIGRGDAHREVEEALDEANSLMTTLALALFDDGQRGGDVYEHVNHRWGHWAGDTVRACNEGVHGKYEGKLRALVDDAESLTDRLGSTS